MCPSQPSTERTMRPLGSLAAGILRFASTCSFGVNTASGTPRAEALRGGNTAAAPRTEALRAEKRPEPRLAAELRLPVVGCRPSGHGNEGMGDAGAQSSSQPSSGDVVERRPPLSAAGLGLHAPTADDGADDDVGVAAMAPTAATGPARGRLGFRVPVEEGVAVAASRLVLRKEDCLEHGVGAALGTLRLRAMPEEGCLPIPVGTGLLLSLCLPIVVVGAGLQLRFIGLPFRQLCRRLCRWLHRRRRLRRRGLRRRRLCRRLPCCRRLLRRRPRHQAPTRAAARHSRPRQFGRCCSGSGDFVLGRGPVPRLRGGLPNSNVCGLDAMLRFNRRHRVACIDRISGRARA
mmetsp:Transcript_56494/g.183005  ORF Transcript_56494/g.183005 Transcript_56494/m.183005 type:complete len:347 (-) Transcript_56494:2590-3630(-)